MPGSSESTALNNTVLDEPIVWVYKYDVIKQTYLLDSQEKYSVWRERQHPTKAQWSGRKRERERERERERGKNSQAELKPLGINNWRHSFYVQAQQRWLLKCHLGRNIEMKETPLSINYWRSVWLSRLWVGQEASRGYPLSPRQNCQAGIGCHSVRSGADLCEEFRCFIAWTHAKSVKNIASLWPRTRPR